MNSKDDQINRAVWILVQGIKDSLETNVMTAVKSKQVELKQDQLSKLLAVISQSVEAGYHAGSKTLTKSIVSTLSHDEPAKKK